MEEKKMSAEQKEFFNSNCTSNEQWAAQQIMLHFSNEDFQQLKRLFSKLDSALYKSWAKDLSLTELTNALMSIPK